MNMREHEPTETAGASAGRLNREDDPAIDTAPETAGSILYAIRLHGYAHLSTPGSYEEFAAISAGLGEIESRTDLKIDDEMNRAILSRRSVVGSGQRPSVFTADEIGFHADTPEVAYIGWYCYRQDEADGALLMIDLGDIDDYFSPEELAALGRITVKWTTRENGMETAHAQPIVVNDGGINRFYYAPWLLDHPDDVEGNAVLDRFVAHLTMLETTRAIAVRLRQGESLFIDNRRMLHARHAISPDSRRHIVRLRMRGEVAK